MCITSITSLISPPNNVSHLTILLYQYCKCMSMSYFPFLVPLYINI
ncbi:hypothetical protein [Enterococcus phage PEF1]